MLERGLSFALSASGRKQLRDLGLVFLAKDAGLSVVPSGRQKSPGNVEDKEVVVDLLSLACARGFSHCATALVDRLSEDALTALRAAGRLHQPLKIAMHVGDTRVVRHLLLRLCPSLPLPQSAPPCLLDIAPSSPWMSGGISRLSEEGSVLLQALKAGRWEALHEVLGYLVRLLSLSHSETLARQFAFGGAGGQAGDGVSAGDGGPGVAGREKMFKRWVEETVLLGREVDLLETCVRKPKREEACSSIVSLLDGIQLPVGDRREGSDARKAVETPWHDWQYDAQSTQINERVTGKGQDLDVNSQRIVAAMRHVVFTRERGACPLVSCLQFEIQSTCALVAAP